jgi:hypothetical protein
VQEQIKVCKGGNAPVPLWMKQAAGMFKPQHAGACCHAKTQLQH